MKALQEYMQLREISQLELAKFLEVDPTQLNHWLHRRQVPTVRKLKSIAKKTGIKLERLAEDF